MTKDKSVWTGIKRGLTRCCANCGKGRLFAEYLEIRSSCEVCGADNNIYPADDIPPYLTILVSGHVIVPLFIVTDSVCTLPAWLEATIWLPATLTFCLAILLFMKGAAVGLCWAMEGVRQDVAL